MNFLFLRQAVAHTKKTGAVAPSSKTLIRKMVEPVDFAQARTIVELGAGTGNITKEILRRMRPDARLFAFEANPQFCEVLKTITDNRLTIIDHPAEEMVHQLQQHSIHTADYVLSGLPLGTLGSKTTRCILDAVSSILTPDGLYIQFQYSLLSKKLIKQQFPNTTILFTPINLPPAFIYVCKKKASTLVG